MSNSSSSFKSCSTCKKSLPATSEYFHKQIKGKYGFTSKCKLCKNVEIESWRQNNLEKHHSYKVKWRISNREKYLDSKRRGEARRRSDALNNGYELYTQSDVLSLYGTSCSLCGHEIDLDAPRNCIGDGWEMGLHIDHNLQLVLGGSDTLDNVRPTHAICNVSKNRRN